jgi:Domain of unknown function (DUF4735)
MQRGLYVANSLTSLVFTEFVCPNLGFSEFFHSYWLQQILSWQKPSGCWGQEDADKKRKVSQLENLKNTGEAPIGESFQQGAFLQPPVHQTRKLLYEVSLAGKTDMHSFLLVIELWKSSRDCWPRLHLCDG